jgi:hypothetical protein
VNALRQWIDVFTRKKRAYQRAFGPEVLDNEAWVDWARFCRVFRAGDINTDRDRMLIYHGRREAFEHVFAYLHLEPHELASFFRAVVLPESGEDE